MEDTESYVPNSELKLPHLAAEDGYGNGLKLTGSTYGQASEPFAGGYFLRTRVAEEGGNVQSANYAKIYGGIEVDARGSISFLYYFNPTANDRNLEFDPEANLAKDQRRSYDP